MRSVCSIAIPSLLVFAGSACGATITYSGPINQPGTGFGNVLNVLTLQNTPSELGSVLWNGTTNVLTGNAMNQSTTRTAAQINAAGISASSQLGLVFNINETGGAADVTLQGFTVRFLSPTGATLFDAVQTGSQVLTAVNQGTGGAGHLFNISLSGAESAQFFGNANNRIGLIVGTAILNTDDGPENFFLVPAPGTAGLLMVAAVSLRGRRRSY